MNEQNYLKDPYIEDKPLFVDGRGVLHEIIRHSYNGQIKQVYITGCASGVVKAWHLHRKQIDRFCVIEGAMKIGVWDESRDMTWTFYLTEQKPQVLTIPPNLWHGFTAIWGSEARVLNCVSEEYDGKDEFRKSWDAVPSFDWHKEVNG